MIRSWLSRLLAPARPSARRPRPQLESLESRLAPAFDLTVGGTTLTNVTRTESAVTAFYTATGDGANIPWAGIFGDMIAGRDVVITSGSAGTQAGNITVNAPTTVFGLGFGRTLTVASGTGANLVGDITFGNVPFAATNLTLIVSANRDLTLGQLDVLAGTVVDARLSAGRAITGGQVIATDVRLIAGSAIGSAASPFLTRATNLSARTTAAGGGIWITEEDDLRLASLGGPDGVQTNNGPIVLRTTNGDLNTNGQPVSSGAGPIDILLGGSGSRFDNASGLVRSNGAPVRIRADVMNLGTDATGIDTAANGRVELAPTTAGTAIILGSTATDPGALRLSDAELDTINTPLLQIGDGPSGAITVSANLSQSKNLTLVTGAGVSGAGSITNGSATPVTFTIDQPGSSTYAGAIGGPSTGSAADRSVAFVKIGAGTLTLTGPSAYSGTTAVNAGALVVNGTTGPGNISVNAGGTLGGTGQLGGSVTVQENGTLSPGSGAAGTLTIGGGLTFLSGSTFLVDIGTGAACDSVTAAGPVAIGDGINLRGTAASPLVPGTYSLIVPTVTVTGNGFRDVTGTRTPPPIGGPITVGGQRFNYAFNSGGVGFGLVARGTAVVLDGGNLTVTDTGAQDDNLFVSLVGDNLRIHDPDNGLLAGPGLTVVDPNTIEVPLAAVTGELLLDTRAGNDAATFFLTPNSLPAGGARFEGGAGTNRFAVQGTAAVSATYTPSSARAVDGLFQLPGRSLRYTSAQAVDVSGLGGLTFRSPGGDDDLVVDEGFDAATRAIPALVLSGTSGGVPLRPVSVWGVGTLTVDTTAADGADTVTVFGAANAHVIGGFTVLTGAGADALTFSGAATFTGNLLLDTGAIALNALVRFGTSATLDTGTGPITTTASQGLAGGAVVMTGSAVGTASAPIRGAFGSLQATATASGVFVVDQDGLTLLGIMSAGDVAVTATALVVSEPVTATGHDVLLRALAGPITGAGQVRATSLLALASGGIDLNTAIDTLTASSGTAGIAVANAGALMLNEVAASTVGDVTLTAEGAITSAAAGTAVTGGALVFEGTAVGTAAAPVRTSVISLAATATAGGVFVTDQGGLTLNGVEAAGDVAVSAGSLDLTGPLAAAGRAVTLTATAGGLTGLGATVTAASLTATASGGILLDTDITSLEAVASAGVVVITNAGALDLVGAGVRASGNVTVAAGGAITSAAAGTAVTGGALVFEGTAVGTAAAPVRTSVISLAATATAGGVFVTDQGGLTLNGVEAAGDVAVSAGSLTLSAGITAADRVVTLTATAGAIGGPGVVQAAGLVASATAGIDLDTAVDALTTSTGTGGITVANAGALTLTGVEVLTSGDITITADALAVSATVRGPGAVILTVADQAGAGQNIGIAAGVAVSAGAALTLRAGDDLTVGAGANLSGGTITLRVDAGNADAGSGGTATLTGATVTGPVTLEGNADADTFAVAPAVLTIDGRGGSDRLTLTTGDAAQEIELSGARISGGAGFDVTYTSTGGGFGRGVALTTGAGADRVMVSGTSAPTEVSTLGGADTVRVAGPAALATLLTAPLNLDAGSEANTLEVSDEPSAVGGTYTLEAGSVAGPGFTLLYVATGGSFGLVRVTASAAADRIQVVSKGGARVIAEGAGGEDAFEVSVGADNPPTGIEVDGGAGLNSLRTVDTTGGALIRDVPSAPGRGTIVVSYVINASTEYAYRNIGRRLGIDPAGNYIIALFRHSVGRNPTAREKIRWTAVLRGGGRLRVAGPVATSAAGRVHLVRFWYQVFKNRAPSAAEEAPLVRLLRLGRSEESVLGTMLGSPRAAYQVGVRTKLVDAYFRERLGRAPTAAESAAYVYGTQTLQTIRMLIDTGREFYSRGL